jgi:hypothetical protein
MKRRLSTKKILVATLGVGAVSYVVACSSDDNVGNLMPPNQDASAHDSGSDVSSSGNLMAPGDSSTQDSNADVSSSGNLMAPDGSAKDGSGDSALDTGADVSSSGNLVPPADASGG